MLARVASAMVVLSSTASAAPLRSVAFSHGEICAVDARGAIACNKENIAPSVTNAQSIAFSYVFAVVDDQGKLAVGNVEDREVVDVPLPFKVAKIGFTETKLCAFGTKGELACGEPKPDKLKVIAPPAKTRFVSATFDASAMFLIDDKGGLWCEGEGNCALLYAASQRAGSKPLLDEAWRTAYPKPLDKVKRAARWRMTGDVVRIHAGGSPCIERAKQPLVCWSWAQPPTAETVSGADEIVTVNNNVCWRKGDAVTCRYVAGPRDDIAAEKTEPRVATFQVKGAARLHAGHDRLCVETKAGVLSCTEVRGGQPIEAFAPVTWAK